MGFQNRILVLLLESVLGKCLTRFWFAFPFILCRDVPTTATAVDGTESIGEGTSRGMSQGEPSRVAPKRRLSEEEKGKAVASPESGKRGRSEQNSRGLNGISIQ